MARPTKYTPALSEAVLRALKTGATRMASAQSVGIAYETFRDWMVHKMDFSAAVTRAEAEAELLFTAVIARAAKGTAKAPGDWRAAESWLKRRRRAEWGDSIDVRKLDDDTILRLLSLEGGSETEGTPIE